MPFACSLQWPLRCGAPLQISVQGEKEVAVAVRSKSILATAFHPELTDDIRWYAPILMLLFWLICIEVDPVLSPKAKIASWLYYQSLDMMPSR